MSRTAASREMPAAMRREVRLLGEVLGQVLAEYGGPKLLDAVEQLRRTVILARGSDQHELEAERLVKSWSLDRAEQVARAFTCYFQLVNLAEERQRVRALRERDRGPETPAESLEASVDELRKRYGDDRIHALLADLSIHPVFTAHPTEARRRAVVAVLARVAPQLARLDDPRATKHDELDARRRLFEEVDTLWRTAQLRSNQVSPLDEVRTVMAVFDESLFRVVPEIYRDLDTALQPDGAGRSQAMAPAFLRFGSWVGGDRDGNDRVTAEVTVRAIETASEHVLIGLEAAITRVGRALTADSVTTPAGEDLRARLAVARDADPAQMAEIETRSPAEHHRQFLLYVAEKVRATRLAKQSRYRRPAELIADLQAVQASLAGAGAPRLAFGQLQHIVWQVQTFGFHFAEIEIRQHSGVHERACLELRNGEPISPETEEVLNTMRAIRSIQESFGTQACRRYIVSLTRSVADIANVYALAKKACDDGLVIEVVPLFETVNDLSRAAAILDEMLGLEQVQQRVRESGRIEVMLGYSDSTKEVGPVSASLALYAAQEALVKWARHRRVRLTIFHGRGGALGRGGGPANRAIRAQAPGSIDGHFKVTEQGEVIFARYMTPDIARRHLEQVTSAVLLSSPPEVEAAADQAAGRFRGLAAQVDGPARAAYRALVEADGFEDWFGRVTPIDELGRLRIGSRPQRRGVGKALAQLRAIPWVFAWSQVRLNLPGWYGLGSGLDAAEMDELQQAYAEWPLFNSLLDNAEMSLAKTDRKIAARYLEMGGRPDLTDQVLAEYDLTIEKVLAVTRHARLLENRRVLSWAVELRNPYVDALSHIQLQSLRALRTTSPGSRERNRLEQVLLLTVNGIAAGLQNTG